jgi:hypothetical protein
MRLQGFGGLNDPQFQFDLRISTNVQTDVKFDQQNLQRTALIEPGKLESEVGEAFVATLFDRSQLFAFPSEAVAVEFCNSEHFATRSPKAGFGTGPLDLLRGYRSVPRLALRFIA